MSALLDASRTGKTWEQLADDLLDVAREARDAGDFAVSFVAAYQAAQCLAIVRNLATAREYLDQAMVH